MSLKLTKDSNKKYVTVLCMIYLHSVVGFSVHVYMYQWICRTSNRFPLFNCEVVISVVRKCTHTHTHTRTRTHTHTHTPTCWSSVWGVLVTSTAVSYSFSLPSLLQRALGTLYSDSIFVEPQPKQPRLVILPHEGTEEGGGEELHPLGATSDSSDTSGRRMLEAAG